MGHFRIILFQLLLPAILLTVSSRAVRGEDPEDIQELRDQQRELRHFLSELKADRVTRLIPETRDLIRLQKQRLRLHQKLHRLWEHDKDAEAERFEIEAEELAEDFEYRVALLEVRFELHWAREERDLKEIRRLSRELRQLLDGEESEEQGDDQEDEEWDSGEDYDEGHRERSAAPEADGPIHPPVDVTEQEVQQATRLSWQKQVLPLLQRHCYSCHDAESASGDFDLRRLSGELPLVVNREHWLNARQQLRMRSMPPADAEQPTEDERRTLVAWLTHAIERFDYNTVRQPGHEPARRMTHKEYNNTIRDLLGQDLRPADRFPADLTASSGFRNSANSLFIQPVLMERYLTAADEVVSTVFPDKDAIREWRHRHLPQATSDRNIIPLLLVRAWRRPVSHDEQSRLLSVYDQELQRTADAAAAMRATVAAMLISPEFLLLTESLPPNDTQQSWQISDYELASRLSYFLWASMPDETLFQLARENRLHQPDELRQQVRRMLQDPRAETLGRVFAAQWLGTNQLTSMQPDQIEHPWATDSLITSMQEETALFFNSLVRENTSIDQLIDADFSWVNEELAGHYGLKNVRGQHMRRVSMTGSRGGGVLAHSSVQAITSFPGRSSPVVRGNWILSTLLGTPPPPPPPNVERLDVDEDEEGLSFREHLQRHRRNPNCYTCHAEIDPLGFALEEFSWFGQQRDGDIDAVGQLPNGRTVQGLAGLKRALLEERRDDLVNQITRSMFAYALGRQLEYYDEATVQDVLREVQTNDRRLQTLIQAIVLSETFRFQQTPREHPYGR